VQLYFKGPSYGHFDQNFVAMVNINNTVKLADPENRTLKPKTMTVHVCYTQPEL